MSRRIRQGLTRREWLSSAGTVLAAGSVGCVESDGTASETAPDGSGEEPTTGGNPSETATPTPVHPEYETAVVRVETGGGAALGSVTAAIADTGELRVTGLSETDRLPEDRGMLFVYESVADRTFVMRGMSFGIDIVYADGEGVITTIHHAPEPGPGEDGSQQHYPGRGQYVLEVNNGWTTERGVSTDDVLDFEL